jgi:hypothetical protein
MIWSRNEQWMVTGDDKGYVKYWQANMNNVKMFQGHFEAIRGLRYIESEFNVSFIIIFIFLLINEQKIVNKIIFFIFCLFLNKNLT